MPHVRCVGSCMGAAMAPVKHARACFGSGLSLMGWEASRCPMQLAPPLLMPAPATRLPAAVAKQVKTLGAKLRIQQGEEEGEDSEEEAAQKRAGNERWGSKRAYYDADNIDLEVRRQ